MLECADIVVTYGGQKVLRDVSIAVAPGKVTAIVGPSGAGKSTILRTLAFLESPVSGSITLDDETFCYPLVPDGPLPQPWPRVTAVFQQLFLWPHLTLRNNILLPLRLRSVADAEARIESLCHRFDMDDFVDRYPNEVSGGQRQRAALARALALKPTYLLLDEITSALDVEQAAAIVSHLGELTGEGIGVLLVTHYLGFLQRTADHIVFMEDGEVVESRGPDILSSPRSKGMQRFIRAFDQIDHPISNQREIIVPRYGIESLDLLAEDLSCDNPKALFARQLHDDLAQHALADDSSISCAILDEQISLLAEAIFARLRKMPLELPNEQDAARLNRIPIVDQLRLRTRATDVEWIEAALSNERPEASALLITLLQPFATDPHIHDFFLQLWKTTSPAIRVRLLWRIVDKQGLSVTIKQEVFEFILAEWDLFNRHNAKFLARDTGVIDQVQSRLNDPRFPPDKMWAYLCWAVDLETDKSAVRDLLEKHLESSDEFTTHVARTLLERFFLEHSATNNGGSR